jgi:hypothetical protein
MKSEVLQLAEQIIETCRKRTPNRVLAATATQLAGAAISAEWGREDDSQSSEEASQPQPAVSPLSVLP